MGEPLDLDRVSELKHDSVESGDDSGRYLHMIVLYKTGQKSKFCLGDTALTTVAKDLMNARMNSGFVYSFIQPDGTFCCFDPRDTNEVRLKRIPIGSKWEEEK